MFSELRFTKTYLELKYEKQIKREHTWDSDENMLSAAPPTTMTLTIPPGNTIILNLIFYSRFQYSYKIFEYLL